MVFFLFTQFITIFCKDTKKTENKQLKTENFFVSLQNNIAIK